MLLFFYLIILLTPSSYLLSQEVKIDKMDTNLDQPYFFYKALGNEYRLLKYYDLAIANYEKALVINKNCIYCLYWKVFLYIDKEDYFNAYLSFNNLESAINKKEAEIPKKVYYNHFFLKVILNYKNSGDSLQKIPNMENELDKLEKDFNNDLSEISHQDETLKNLIFFFLGKTYFYRGIFFKHHPIEKVIFYFKNSIYYNYKVSESQFELYKIYKANNKNEEAEEFLKLLKEKDPIKFLKILSKYNN